MSVLGLTGALVAGGLAVLVVALLLFHRPLELEVAGELAEAPAA